MREILFRGKRVDNGEWVYGSLQTFRNQYKEIENVECKILQADKYKHMTNFDPNRDKRKDFKRDWISYEVDPNTVSQYTGLEDRNGVKIFEGDVLRVEDSMGYAMKSIIVSTEYGFGLQSEYGGVSPLQTKFHYNDGRIGTDVTNVFEVIGNIHELEGEDMKKPIIINGFRFTGTHDDSLPKPVLTKKIWDTVIDRKAKAIKESCK